MIIGASISCRSAGLLVVLFMLVFAPFAATAQDPPFNTELVGTWDGFGGGYADVWGDGDYAYVGQFGDAGVLIIDISDPTSPFLAAEYSVPAPNASASAQDVKVGDGLLFIALEGNGGPDSVQIVDVRDPTSPNSLATIRIDAVGTPHNIFYDRGFLYIVDSGSERVAIVDLTDFDPDSPPGSPISDTLWVIQDVGTVFVHDITVRIRPSGETWLYACGWDSGLFIYDVTNIALQPPQLLASVDGNNTHSVWPTDNGRFVITGEERNGGGITVFEIIEDGGGVSLELRDSLSLPDEQATSVHNQFCVANRVYSAWYQAGMRAYDIDPIDGRLTLASSFDTFGGNPQGFNGAWGVYPLLGSDRVLVSDLSTGLYIINDLISPALVSFSYPNGLVDLIDPIDGATMLVTISGLAGTPDPATATLFIESVALPGEFDAFPMTDLGGDLYEAQFPGIACGNLVSYFVSIQTLEGGIATDPADAPTDTFSAEVLSSINVFFADDFETDAGWITSSSADAGAWERAIPAGSSGQRGDPITDFDGSGRCYVTGNGFDEDLDEGPVILTSPAIDLSSAADAVLSYARWFTNDDGDDFLTVEISNDGGSNWVELETVATSTDWVEVEFTVADFVTPTDSMVLRFTSCDCPNNSVTEAAIDAVRYEVGLCDVQPGCEDILGSVFACNTNNALKMGIFLTDFSHDGQTVTFEVDGVPHDVTVVGQRARLFLPGQSPGDYTLELTEPAGCVPAETVTCN